MQTIFSELKQSKSVADLENIINRYNLSNQLKAFEDKYPIIDLSLFKADIQALIDSKVISDDHKIILNAEKSFTPFEKLLLSVLWKNGHINRVQPIVDGIMDEQKSESEYGVIFRQVGRSLSNSNEPIVDQHVLRAFCAYEDLSNIIGRKIVPRNAALKNSDEKLVNAYRNWFKNIFEKVTDDEKQKFKYKFDKIIFLIGKSLSK